jgi:hypothetical protein
VVLKALTSKRVEEVAYNLVDIFSLLQAPSILQSDNSREFVNNVLSILKEYWPTLKIVHGKPCHSQSQGSVKRANQAIQNMLCTWMQDKKTDHWSEGLRFVQLKNRAYHSGIKRTPYEAVFGCKAKVDLTTSSLPQDVLQDIQEEQLEKIIESVQTVQEDKTNHPMQEKEPVAQNMDEIVVDDGRNQYDDEDMFTKEASISATCCVCLKETSDEHVCRKCRRKIHRFCGHASKGDGDEEMDILCTLCFKTENAVKGKIDSKFNLEIQAKKMKMNSDKKFPPPSLGATVRVLIPDINKGPGDSRHLLAVVMSMTEDGFYRLVELLKEF